MLLLVTRRWGYLPFWQARLVERLFVWKLSRWNIWILQTSEDTCASSQGMCLITLITLIKLIKLTTIIDKLTSTFVEHSWRIPPTMHLVREDQYPLPFAADLEEAQSEQWIETSSIGCCCLWSFQQTSYLDRGRRWPTCRLNPKRAWTHVCHNAFLVLRYKEFWIQSPAIMAIPWLTQRHYAEQAVHLCFSSLSWLNRWFQYLNLFAPRPEQKSSVFCKVGHE